jgi:phospholipid/cholesterol/gamma-HCH transport system substrate-binding protein
MKQRTEEILVGFFVLAGIVALFILAFKVSGLSFSPAQATYTVTANFDNIGGLKVRAPVTIGGVKIGEITSIGLDSATFKAEVVMKLSRKIPLPLDTSASILTQGLLGANYISLTPGFDTENLKNGGQIVETHSALVLENLIGQFIFSIQKNKEQEKT